MAGAASQVTLAWDRSNDSSVTGYNLYYGQASGTYTNVVPCGPATSIVISNLALGVSYYFAATAINEAGLESGFSSEVVYQSVSGAGTVTIGNTAQVYDGKPKPVSISTTPASLSVNLTYNGSTSAPVAAGSYQVVATIADPNYTGSATNLLIVARANAAILLSGLGQVFDGTPKLASASTIPSGLAVNLVYAWRTSLPVNAGIYPVGASIADANYSGTASNALVIAKAQAKVFLGNLDQIYDGTSKGVAATTLPQGLAVVLTYNAQSAPPSKPGSYTVVGIVNDGNYSGTATNLLSIVRAKERPIAGAARFPANTPQVAPGSAGSSSVMVSLHWSPADEALTIFESTDLVAWKALTNVSGASGSLSFPDGPGAHFFASGRIGGTNLPRLWISKP